MAIPSPWIRTDELYTIQGSNSIHASGGIIPTTRNLSQIASLPQNGIRLNPCIQLREFLVIDPEFVSMLRCPVDQTTLELADPALIDAVNHAIGRSEAVDRIDQKVDRLIDGGLRTGNWLYPIRGGIPTLVADEAIAINDLIESAGAGKTKA